MNKIKPNNFPYNTLPLTGNEEQYTQDSNSQHKFTVQDIWNAQPVTVVNSGQTINNNSDIDLYYQNIVINNTSSGNTFITGATIQSGNTCEITDNGNGTWYFDDSVNIGIIKPVDYFACDCASAETLTGEFWVDNKQIYRLIVFLDQWTIGNEGVFGDVLISSGQTFETVTRLDVFAYGSTINNPSIIYNLNVGDGYSWSGGFAAVYDGINSSIRWEGLMSANIITQINPTIYFIMEYTKP